MNAGWFHSNWWPENWWYEDWWTDYGAFGRSDFVLPSIVSVKDPNKPRVGKVIRVSTPKVVRGESV